MGRKILVVDDEVRIVDLLRRVLIQEGFDVYTATNGKAAIDLLNQITPDLIILDVMMPGMDGGDVAAEILKEEETKGIPIIYCTGAISDEEAASQNRQTSACFYISKTSSIKEQVKIIKEVLAANS